MATSSSAAGIIAGMIHSRNHLGQAWDSLDPDVATKLVEEWSDAIAHGKQEGIWKVLSDIESVEELRKAWEECGEPLKAAVIQVVNVIIENVHPEA